MELKYVHGHTLRHVRVLTGDWASPHAGMIFKLIEIMTPFSLIMKTLARAFICLSYTNLYKLVYT